ncbi:MAG: carboxypeptidase-like regulatory domain-containing protein, partial [Bacteroidia bacterium]
FKDAEKPLTALRGVINADSTQKRPPATITITDLKTNDALETKDINPATGKYIFIVEPGKYRIEIEAEGYVNLSEDITVYDKSDFVGELEKNFKLRSKNSSVPSNPNNSTVPKK